MANKPREIPRFTIGQAVTIRDFTGSIEAGTDGTVMSIQAHRQRRTLDKYLIRLSSGSEKVFWDIHLKAAVNEGLQ
jgi:hypothetical protein